MVSDTVSAIFCFNNDTDVNFVCNTGSTYELLQEVSRLINEVCMFSCVRIKSDRFMLSVSTIAFAWYMAYLETIDWTI